MKDYSKFTWSGFEWIPQERWGICHPIKPEWWYDSERVEIDNDGVLHLKTKWNPKYINDEIGESQIGCGLISSVDKFKYGEYEIEAKLPQGKDLWPAFWMWAWESYPPEIDVLEAYSTYANKIASFWNGRLFEYFAGKFWRVESNIHLIDETSDDNWTVGSKRSYFGFKAPSKQFIKYKLIWTKDLIEIYYDDRLNRRITDRNILKQFDNITMNVIINNGITGDANPKNIMESDFQIKYFNYKPIN
jgi:beta-glucanase (GH16 family)